MMQAILIDPFTQTIEAVDYSGDYKDIYSLLECDLFTTVYRVVVTAMADTLYVDDEGLYVEDQKFFKLKGYPQPLAGRGLVLGSTDDGDSTDCVSTVEDIQDIVEWCADGMTVEPRFEVIGFDDFEDLLNKLDS